MKIEKLSSVLLLFSVVSVVSLTLVSTHEALSLSDLDRDFDGVPDELDECPQTPETYNRFQDGDGCPDSIIDATSRVDSDNDGIYDLKDHCPTQPENFNGIFDRDGCPDDYIPISDRDGDGLADAIDDCPTSKETYNKFQDDDGCPDSVSEEITSYQFPDVDGDGIEDRRDTCIYEPEIFNDYLDHDGCPDFDPVQSRYKHDSDLDNINNDEDMCPLEPEDYDGDRDLDGCPDLSSKLSGGTKDSSLTSDQCMDDKILVIRINSQDPMCVSLDIAKKWESYGIAKIISESLPSEETPIIPPLEVIPEVTEPDEIVTDSSDQGPEPVPIIRLSSDEVEKLLEEYGTPFEGMTKTAILNGYPGPHHVLDAAQSEEIELTHEQQLQIQALYEEMRLESIDLGTQIIEIEKEIEKLFVDKVISEDILDEKVSKSADLFGQLRFVHLKSHLDTVNILTPLQVDQYNELQGYTSADPCDSIPEDHMTELWKLYNKCQ